MKPLVLPAVKLAFRHERRSQDKFRGLKKFGPFRPVPTNEPSFGFVFPSIYREYANKLFLSLKNGAGPVFTGVENMFRFRLQKNQVFHVPVHNYKPDQYGENSRAYTDAISEWKARQTNRHPDLFFLLHPKSPTWRADTPYYACKASALNEGVVSQSVTLDLLDNPTQFGWSIANIALAVFAKIGGIPWVVHGEELENNLIIGIGRTHLFDSIRRQNKGMMAFTACFFRKRAVEFRLDGAT